VRSFGFFGKRPVLAGCTCLGIAAMMCGWQTLM
jgi:hypothetical protein